MSSEIIAAIDKELEGLREEVGEQEKLRDKAVADLRRKVAERRVACAENCTVIKARIKHLERVRKVETGEAKVVVKREGGAE